PRSDRRAADWIRPPTVHSWPPAARHSDSYSGRARARPPAPPGRSGRVATAAYRAGCASALQATHPSDQAQSFGHRPEDDGGAIALERRRKQLEDAKEAQLHVLAHPLGELERAGAAERRDRIEVAPRHPPLEARHPELTIFGRDLLHP